MKKLTWLLYVITILFMFSCSETENEADYFFKAVENYEDRLPAEILYKQVGGSFEVMFETGQDWNVTFIGDDANWLHMSNMDGGAGVNTVVLTADPNVGADRSAVVQILAKTVGKRIKITQSGNSEKRIANRSVLAFLAAENSLSRFAIEDLMEMVEGAQQIPDNNHLLVYVDDTKYPRIYEIGRNEIGIADTLRVMSFEEDLDSADPATLEMALNFMKENYNAEEYGLIMWSHGDGWIPGSKRTRYIGIDNNRNSDNDSGSFLGIDGFKEAIINSVGYLELAFFDACFMMTAEVAYELRDCCHYMVGSPCEIPGPGAPYHMVVPTLFADDLSRGQIAETYYQYYQDLIASNHGSYGAILTTVNCSAMEDFADVTAKMAAKYFQIGAKISSRGWVQYGFGETVYGHERENMYLDVKQVMHDTLNGEDYKEWLDAFSKVVLSFSATEFWYSEAVMGKVKLDVEKVGGLAITIPLLVTDSKVLEDLKKVCWFNRVWE